MAARACKLSTLETEAGGSRIPGQPGPYTQQNKNRGVGEMGVSKVLPSKHKDLSSVPPCLHRKPDMMAHTCNSSPGQAKQGQEGPWGLPASQPTQ